MQIQHNMLNDDNKKKISHKNTLYNEQVSQKKNKKRKRKIYKSQLTKLNFFAQSIEFFFEFFFKRSLQFSLETINIKRSNIQIN